MPLSTMTRQQATDLGSVLRHHRQRVALRPEQVAVHVGRSAQTVMNWELDRRVPSLTQLGQLAALYGVTAGELLDAVDPCTQGSDPA